MNNSTRNELVRARNSIEDASLNLTELGYGMHRDLNEQQRSDCLDIASDMQRRELADIVQLAVQLGEPDYTEDNTSIAPPSFDGSEVLWYHHPHPDTGERIYTRIATSFNRETKIILSLDYPAITRQKAHDLIRFHKANKQ